MESSNKLLTLLVCVVLISAIFAIGYPGWELSVRPFQTFDRIRVKDNQIESEVNSFLKPQSTVSRPRQADEEWKKHPDAAWRVTYDTGGRPGTIVVWFDARKQVIGKQLGE